MAFLEIQKLTAQQLPAVVELDRLCFGGLWTLEGYQRELDSPNSDLLGLWTWESQEKKDTEKGEALLKIPSVWEPPPSLVGCGCLWAILDEAHITIVAIHPHSQRQGLGQALLYALLKEAYQRNLERATLEVRASNTPALSLYQKFGFQEAGRRRRYYEDTGEDALILWRSGLSRPQFLQDLTRWKLEIHSKLCNHNLSWVSS